MARLLTVGLAVAIGVAIVWALVSLGPAQPDETVMLPTGQGGEPREFTIETILAKDAIRSIDSPQFIEGSEADSSYDSSELVLGISINGDSRAYSVPVLSRHEIVNDVVGGKPVAVTW